MFWIYLCCILLTCCEYLPKALLSSEEPKKVVTLSLANKIYTLHKTKENWKTAKTQCTKSGGHLARDVSSQDLAPKVNPLSVLLELAQEEVAWIGARARKVTVSEDVKLRPKTKEAANNDTLWCGNVKFQLENSDKASGKEIKNKKLRKVITKQKCTDRYHYICKLEDDQYNPEYHKEYKTEEFKEPKFCSGKAKFYVKPDEKSNSTGICYELYGPTNWYDAWSICHLKNGTLFNDVLNLDKSGRKILKNMITHFGEKLANFDEIWVDLSNHLWIWEPDESPVFFNKTMGKKLLSEGWCSRLRQRGNFLSDWINSDCSDLYPFICETDLSKLGDKDDEIKEYDCFRAMKIFPAIQKFDDILIIGPYLILGIVSGIIIMMFPFLCTKCKLFRLQRKQRKIVGQDNPLYSMTIPAIAGGQRSPIPDLKNEYASPGDWLPFYIPPPPKEKPPPLPCSCGRCAKSINSCAKKLPRIEIKQPSVHWYDKPKKKKSKFFQKIGKSNSNNKGFEPMYSTATRRNAITLG